MKSADDQIASLMAALLAGRLTASNEEIRQARQLATRIQSEASKPRMPPLEEAFERFNEGKGPKDWSRPPTWLNDLTQKQNRSILGSLVGQPAKLLLSEFLRVSHALTDFSDVVLDNELERLRAELPAIESLKKDRIPFDVMPHFLLALKRRYSGSHNEHLSRLRRAAGGAKSRGRPKGKASDTMAAIGKQLDRAAERHGVKEKKTQRTANKV